MQTKPSADDVLIALCITVPGERWGTIVPEVETIFCLQWQKTSVHLMSVDKRVVPIIRVTFVGRHQGKRIQRTVVTGKPLLSQLVTGVAEELLKHVQKAYGDRLDQLLKRMTADVRKEIEKMRGDDAIKKTVADGTAKILTKIRASDHKGLVRTYRELIRNNWKKEDVLAAWDEAEVEEVHDK